MNTDGIQNSSSPAKAIRKEFFAFRNGIVADKLRKAGDPHKTIMGCLLVDITSITGRLRETIGNSDELAALAQELWSDTNSRECRLAAPMLYPAEAMSKEQAQQWGESVETVEIADNLCHKLLRHINGANDLYPLLIKEENILVKYTGYRLLLNLILLGKVKPTESLKATIVSESEQAQTPLAALLRDILEEFD